MTAGRDEEALFRLNDAANDDELAQQCALGFERSFDLILKRAYWLAAAAVLRRFGFPRTWCAAIADLATLEVRDQ